MASGDGCVPGATGLGVLEGRLWMLLGDDGGDGALWDVIEKTVLSKTCQVASAVARTHRLGLSHRNIETPDKGSGTKER